MGAVTLPRRTHTRVAEGSGIRHKANKLQQQQNVPQKSNCVWNIFCGNISMQVPEQDHGSIRQADVVCRIELKENFLFSWVHFPFNFHS